MKVRTSSLGSLVPLPSTPGILKCIVVGTALLLAAVCRAETAEAPWYGRYVDPDDGMFDLSDYLLRHRGLLPVPIIITEPALGYGGGLAALWFKESVEQASARSLAESGQRAFPTGGVWVAPANMPHYLWAKDGEAVYQCSGTAPTATNFVKQ